MPDNSVQLAERVSSTFDMPITVFAEHIDANGHVNNVVYLSWMQDVALAHWHSVGTPRQKENVTWVVIRHEIDYLRPGYEGDQLVARTRVGESRGARFERIIEIIRPLDNELLAKGRSVWCAVDARTGRPRRVTEEIRSLFFEPLPQ